MHMNKVGPPADTNTHLSLSPRQVSPGIALDLLVPMVASSSGGLTHSDTYLTGVLKCGSQTVDPLAD